MSDDMASFVDQELAGAAALEVASNGTMSAAGPLASALQLIERHIPCFPVLASKAPACPDGFYAATCDPKDLQELWRKHPGCLIGVPTGAASGFDALDLDLAKHTEASMWWEENRGRIPETRAHATRSGG